MSTDPRMELSLEPAISLATKNLPSSEYLVERHSININVDYLSVNFSAEWSLEFGSILVSVSFFVNEEQEQAFLANLDDDTIRDDIDSGIGKVFEEALREVYPEHDWNYIIGQVNIDVKV